MGQSNIHIPPTRCFQLVCIVCLLAAGYFTMTWLQQAEDAEAVIADAGTLSRRFEQQAPNNKPIERDAFEKANQKVDVALRYINDRHFFVPAPGQPFRQIRGILGNQVVFENGETEPVGGSFAGAKVVDLGSDWVKLEHGDETIIVGVYGGRGSYEEEMKAREDARIAKERALLQSVGLLGSGKAKETNDTDEAASEPASETPANTEQAKENDAGATGTLAWWQAWQAGSQTETNQTAASGGVRTQAQAESGETPGGGAAANQTPQTVLTAP